MADVAALTIRLEALKAARDTGALSVRHGDTSTTFRSLSEINKIIADLENQIALATNSTRIRTIRFNTPDGW